jgi:hypothetical protein
MLKMLGLEREEFLVTNVCSFQPPQNRDPTDAEIGQWWPDTARTLRDAAVRVVVPLGNIALRAVLGLDGIQGKRGYIYWSDCLQKWTVPTVHPAFILRGNANWTVAWLRDVHQALQIAQEGPPAAPRRELTLDPTIETAQAWSSSWEAAGRPPLSFDIETPGRDKDEDEVEISLGHEAGTIYRIGFAWRMADATRALSLPWGSGYLPVVSALLGLSTCTVVWNRHFDVPRLQAHGMVLGGQLHDAQEMWHVLYPDLPKKLEFVAPILLPGQSYWKDQSHDRPAFYNATDAAVTIEAFEVLYGSGVNGGDPLTPEDVCTTPQAQINDDDIPF